MSTRCQILVEDATAILYRHSDGYPDGEHGVIAAICPIIDAFTKARGLWDPDYLSAQILAHLIAARHQANEAYMKTLKERGASDKEIATYEEYRFVGFGVEGYRPDAPPGEYTLHGDIEYLYVVKKDGYVEVRTVEYEPDKPVRIESTKVQKCVLFNGKPMPKPRTKKAAKSAPHKRTPQGGKV